MLIEEDDLLKATIRGILEVIKNGQTSHRKDVAREIQHLAIVARDGRRSTIEKYEPPEGIIFESKYMITTFHRVATEGGGDNHGLNYALSTDQFNILLDRLSKEPWTRKGVLFFSPLDKMRRIDGEIPSRLCAVIQMNKRGHVYIPSIDYFLRSVDCRNALAAHFGEAGGILHRITESVDQTCTAGEVYLYIANVHIRKEDFRDFQEQRQQMESFLQS